MERNAETKLILTIYIGLCRILEEKSRLVSCYIFVAVFSIYNNLLTIMLNEENKIFKNISTDVVGCLSSRRERLSRALAGFGAGFRSAGREQGCLSEGGRSRAR